MLPIVPVPPIDRSARHSHDARRWDGDQGTLTCLAVSWNVRGSCCNGTPDMISATDTLERRVARPGRRITRLPGRSRSIRLRNHGQVMAKMQGDRLAAKSNIRPRHPLRIMSGRAVPGRAGSRGNSQLVLAFSQARHSAWVPLNRLRSTSPSIPGTVPVPLYCQKTNGWRPYRSSG